MADAADAGDALELWGCAVVVDDWWVNDPDPSSLWRPPEWVPEAPEGGWAALVVTGVVGAAAGAGLAVVGVTVGASWVPESEDTPWDDAGSGAEAACCESSGAGAGAALVRGPLEVGTVTVTREGLVAAGPASASWTARAGMAGLCVAVTLAVTTETPAHATAVATAVVTPHMDPINSRRLTSPAWRKSARGCAKDNLRRLLQT